MIIGQRFAWGHLGKTGGHTTWELFHLFPEVIVFADKLGHETQHTPFVDRLPQVEGKELALNIRRLPSWMLSYHMHRGQFGDYPDYRPVPMMSPYEMALSDSADEQLAAFTNGGQLEVDYWLRTEHLLEDFAAFISRYVDVSPEKRAQITRFGQKNVGAYDRRLPHWFSPAHIALMYRSNPVWAAVEEKAYDERMSEYSLPARPEASSRIELAGAADTGQEENRSWRARLAGRLRAAR